jgi:hypothetical protein
MQFRVPLTLALRMLIAALSRKQFVLECAHSTRPGGRLNSMLTLHCQNQDDMKWKTSVLQRNAAVNGISGP